MAADPLKRRRAKTPAELISRGHQAAVELARTDEAFEQVRQFLMEAIANTSFEQAEARERLYLSIQVLGPVRDMLVIAVNDGVAAEHQEHAVRIMGVERAN